MISYNNFDFEPIFGKKKNGSSDEKENVGHESTFMKQTLYFLITLVLNVMWVDTDDNISYCSIFAVFRLTVLTLASVTPEGMILVDRNGIHRELTETQVTNMVIIGWVAFFLSWIMNILYYKVIF